MADRLALIPATAKRAEGVNFEVRLDRGAPSASEMINVDLKVGRGCRLLWLAYMIGGWGPAAASPLPAALPANRQPSHLNLLPPLPSFPCLPPPLLCPRQGIVKPALQRLRDAYSTKARDLADQLLSLQEQHDSMRELLAEREEENRNAEAQVGASGCVGGWVGVV